MALWIFGTMLKDFGDQKISNFLSCLGVGASIVLQLIMPFSAEQFAKSTEAAEYAGYSTQLVKEYMGNTVPWVLPAQLWELWQRLLTFFLIPNCMMFIPIPVKAKYAITYYGAIDLFGGFTSIQGDNIAHFAHLGGALIGFLIGDLSGTRPTEKLSINS